MTLLDSIAIIRSEFSQIPEERKEIIRQFIAYLKEKYAQNQIPQFIVICIHNSRRSHFGQIWLSIAASFYQQKMAVFSGGTEATAFHPNAIAAMQRAGIIIEQNDKSINPKYQVSWTLENQAHQLEVYSKKYDAIENPQEKFAAMLVCDPASKECPVVEGADYRLPLHFNDPKEFDNTNLAAENYDKVCRKVAREMFYILELIAV